MIFAAALMCWGAAAAGQTAPAPTATKPKPASPSPSGVAPVPRTTFLATMDLEFRKMDADRNGVLTRKEIEDFQTAIAVESARQTNSRLFQMLDKDQSGTITPTEFAALPSNPPRGDAISVISQTDGNGDGRITLVEYRVAKLANFDRMDADKDGTVSVPEMRAAGLIK